MGEEISFLPFSHNRYLEDAKKLSKPGSVTQMRAYFEAHFKKKGIRFPSCIEAQTWREVVHLDHHQTCTDKDEKLWENLVIADDDHSSLSIALEKTEVGLNEMTLEDEKETTKASNKKHVVITQRSQAPTSTKTERLTSLATREKKTATNGFSFRTSERAKKRNEDKVEAVVCKARPMPKITQARPQDKSTGQAKAINEPSCDRSVANGTAKSKLNIQRSLNGIMQKSSDQTARNNTNRRSLAVR